MSVEAHRTRSGILAQNENPAPTEISSHAIHLSYSASKQSTEGTSQGGRGEEEGEPLLRFGSPVPPVNRSDRELEDQSSPKNPYNPHGYEVETSG